jgi:general secretion pathway protein D
VGLSDFSVSLPGALLQALMTDNTTRVMQSPQVRASDGMKVALKIGQKYPFASGSFQPGIGAVGVSPLVSTQFQFADIGVNVEITPHVHGNDEVTLHVSVDISAIDSTLDLGGLSQPVIGQKKNETDIRVRDGEVSLMGGLLNTQDTRAFSGIPGFVNVPVLGKFLLGSSNKDVERGELLIALIPHIVRTPSLSPLDMEGVGAGTDQTVHVNRAARHEAQPTITTTAGVPVTVSIVPAQTPPPAATPAPPLTGPKLVFSPSPAQAKLGAPFAVTLQVEGAVDLYAAPVKIKWDPKLLRLEQAAPGALLTGDGQKVNAPLDIRNDAGEATVTLTRLPGAPGINGSGSLLVYSFTAIGKGPGTITVTEYGLTNSKKEALTVSPTELPFTVE